MGPAGSFAEGKWPMMGRAWWRWLRLVGVAIVGFSIVFGIHMAVGVGFTSIGVAAAQELEPAVRVNEMVMPAVVQIVTEIEFDRRLIGYAESRIQQGELIREVGPWQRHTARVTGSGTVVFSDTVAVGGEVQTMTLILTNHHVIAYALPEQHFTVFEEFLPNHVRVENWQQRLAPGAVEVAEVRIVNARVGIVVLPDQNFWIPAQVEMYDETMDVALVRVDRVAGVPFVKLGDSDVVRVGQSLFMAGAPLGVPFQLTSGRLGQKNLTVDPMWSGMWRYEVPQAPGSSGSGIFNGDGELVAIARGNLGYAYFIGFDQIFVPQPGQYLGVPVNPIKFLLRWQGYGFIFDYDATDIIDLWTPKKVQ